MDNDNNLKIAAWPDGFWIDDLEAAVELDDAMSQGLQTHKVISVPAGSSEKSIEAAIVEAFGSEEEAA